MKRRAFVTGVGPTRSGLIVNLKAARAMGLAIAPSVLQRADEILD